MERTINEVFENRVQKYGNRVAVEKKRNGQWQSASWREYYDRAAQVGLGLRALGVEAGDRVAVLADNCLEWLYMDMGAMGIGACVVPVYTTLPAEEVEYIVSHAEAKILVVDTKEQLEKGRHALKSCPGLKRVVVVESPGVLEAKNEMSFQDLLELGLTENRKNPGLFSQLSRGVAPEDLATLVYTSGTTGVPKGAMITHGNIMAVLHALDAIHPKYGFDTDQTVPFLPLSHVFERVAGHFYGMFVGLTASYAENINTLLADFAEKRPTVVLAVPRVCEKVYQKIMDQVQQSPAWKQKLFAWGQGVGSSISQYRETKQTPPALLKLQYWLAYRLIFKKLQENLGGRVRWMTASGGPTAVEIIRFFNAAAIMVVEGYGMTECCAPATMSNLADYRIGTAGRPLPGVEIKIAEDGEVLIKGGNVFKGYWKMEEETRETFTPDGFLMSGDIGKFDDAGFLVITDRKKDLIITAGGKNIAPQKIENLFKSDPLFSQFIVIGDRRKYLAALVNINPEAAQRIAEEKGISYTDPVELLENKVFLDEVDRRIAAKNQKLARFETIKQYRIIKHEFSQETGELTASLKVKRRVVQGKYQNLIDSMYENAN